MEKFLLWVTSASFNYTGQHCSIDVDTLNEHVQ